MIICGDNVEVLKGFADNSIDSIVTDPPYGLSFMNKHWDYDVPSVELWQDCLRVLKPGGHLLSFAGTRTYHRMTVRIEDAGFEIRDMISWIYGSGFPKSLDIGKAIDKQNGSYVKGELSPNSRLEHGNMDFMMKEKTLPNPQSPEAIQWNGWGTALKPASEIICVAQKPYIYQEKFVYLVHKLITKICEGLCQSKSFVKIAKKNLALSPNELKEGLSIAQWIADESTNIQDVLSVVMVTLQSCIKENTNLNTVLLWLNTLKEIYSQENTYTTETKTNLITDLKILNSLPLTNIVSDITGEETKQDGQELSAEIAVNIFNAVKVKLSVIQMLFAQENVIDKPLEFSPECNPIVLARKPLIGTVANNVLQYGTGGINIDGCRIGLINPEVHKTEGRCGMSKFYEGQGTLNNKVYADNEREIPRYNTQGRFPANIIFDEIAGVMLDEMSGESKSSNAIRNNKAEAGKTFKYSNDFQTVGHNDKGGASRFFYCAKASKAERNGGLEGFEEKSIDIQQPHNSKDLEERYEMKSKNFHPTVKPLKLMQYLVRLVTPPNGICLDPFCGSGTTLMACVKEGFNYIGIEREADYVKIAEARIEWVKKQEISEQTNLFKI